MNTLFSFVMYHLFGRRWVLYDMKQGLKMAIFVNEAEVAMHRAKIRKHQDELTKLEGELETLKARDPLEGLAEGEDRKAYYDAKKLREKAHAEAVEELEGRIRGAKNSISGTDGELQRIYNISYHNRLKYDFIKHYSPASSYTDI